METVRYALVAYIRNALGEFVENLRSELHPPHAHLPAHITILPPRCLRGTEQEALEQVEAVCQGANPFIVELGEVETFMPVTPTVFIRVAHAAYRMRELHDQMNRASLWAEENWPYMPHLTIAKLETIEAAQEAENTARERWSTFRGSRLVCIEELTFVREASEERWTDLAPVPLGKRVAPIADK
ncbi:MAG TPA: 2'-5' RNA ligase family protein [Terriglobales bacterium]|nr:2'-5' RNA ligase family protein [Terriglobales bacterium]